MNYFFHSASVNLNAGRRFYAQTEQSEIQQMRRCAIDKMCARSFSLRMCKKPYSPMTHLYFLEVCCNCNDSAAVL